MFKYIKIYYKKISKFLYDFKRFHKEGGVTEVSVAYSLPNNRFVGHNVFVTGGSSGIGLAIAKAFLNEGARVIICGSNLARLQNVTEKINSPKLHYFQVDIADVQSMDSKFEEIINILPPPLEKIDIFVNSAGVSVYDGGNMMSEEIYDRLLNVNQKGLFFMNKLQGEYLIKNKIQGRIINITSKAGERSSFDPYTLSKCGANSITKGVARWLAPYHIAVNGIAPGMTPTNITEELQRHINSGNDYNPTPATKRFNRVEEIAELALFLASGAAGNIIGQIINIDGGRWD